MAANVGFVYGETSLELKATGREVTVADSPVAKLMYYLNCVATTLNYSDEVFNRFTRYEQYAQLSVNEEMQLVAICEAISPSILVGRVFYHSEEGSSSNEFYDLSVAKTQMAVLADTTAAVVIGGRNVQVTKIMTYKHIWLTSNYTRPLAELKRQHLQPNYSMLSVTQARYTPASQAVNLSFGARNVSRSYLSKRKKYLPLFGYLMIAIATADLIATFVNIANGGLDITGSGIWAGFLWGLIFGVIMIKSGRHANISRCRRYTVCLFAFLFHFVHVVLLVANAAASDLQLLGEPFNLVEVLLACSLIILDIFGLIILCNDEV